MSRVLVAGETLVDFLPATRGSLASVEQFTRRPGGAPANVAVGLARLDERPLFWTRLGTDPFGDFLADVLDDHGLPDDYVERDPDAKTGLAFVSLDEAAERAFSFYHDAAAETRLEPGTVTDETLETIEWVHVDCLSLDAEPARSAVFDLAKRARAAGATVSFDPNARPERWNAFDYADSVRRGFELADVVKATPDDLRAAGFDGDAAALADAILESGPHTALVTLGDDGAYAATTDAAPWASTAGAVSHDGYDVTPVDTTGAGDAFTAGAIAALVDGASLSESLAFANAVAAATTRADGAMTALPDRDDVRRFRKTH